MKKAFHLALVTALLLAFGQAPFEHTHEGEDHHGQGVHAHGFHSASDGLEWDDVDDDHDVQLREWVTEGGPEMAQLLPAILEQATEFRLVARAERQTRERARNHDPPTLRLLASRGPPSSSLL